MGQDADDTDTDKDIDRFVRSSGRSPVVGALLSFIGAAGIVGIDRVSNGSPSVLSYVAAGVIVACTAPALLVLGLRERRATEGWAEHERQRQKEQAERERRLADLERERVEQDRLLGDLRRELATVQALLAEACGSCSTLDAAASRTNMRRAPRKNTKKLPILPGWDT